MSDRSSREAWIRAGRPRPPEWDLDPGTVLDDLRSWVDELRGSKKPLPFGFGEFFDPHGIGPEALGLPDDDDRVFQIDRNTSEPVLFARGMYLALVTLRNPEILERLRDKVLPFHEASIAAVRSRPRKPELMVMVVDCDGYPDRIPASQYQLEMWLDSAGLSRAFADGDVGPFDDDFGEWVRPHSRIRPGGSSPGLPLPRR